MAGLTNRKIASAMPHPTKEIRLWDDAVRRLGVRIKASGVKTFFLQYRSPVTGKKVRHTIGQFGRYSLDQARDEAKVLLGGLPA